MYHNPDQLLNTFRTNERELHRAAALERAVREARTPKARPEIVRVVDTLTRLARLRPRTS